MVASHDATAASHHDVDLRVEGERETPFRRQPRINAAPEPSEYPALLDSSQWTRSATLPQNDHFTTPSQRIGRHYRQRLDEQNVEQLAHRRSERTAPISPLRPTIDRKGYAVGLACRPLLQPIGQEEEYPESTSMLGVIGRQCEADEEARQAVFQGTHREAHLSNADVLRQRLDNYVLAGVDESTLAPFNDEWADNAMEQVPSRLTGVPQEQVAGMVDEMLSEVQDDYYTAVKTSMVRYVLKVTPPPPLPPRPPARPPSPIHPCQPPPALPHLLVGFPRQNPAEARRVEIAAPPRPFELSTFHPSQDASVAACAAPLSHDSMSLGAWHQNVLSGFEGIDRTLAVNHDGMLQMLDLWGLYSHLLLCNVAPLPPTSPMELDAFKDLQHSHCEKVVQALKKKWFPAVLEIFRREMQQEDEGNNGGGPEGSPLLAAVSTLMSNQLRGLLTASIQALVSFMERYEQTNEEEADLHSELVHDIPADRPPACRRRRSGGAAADGRASLGRLAGLWTAPPTRDEPGEPSPLVGGGGSGHRHVLVGPGRGWLAWRLSRCTCLPVCQAAALRRQDARRGRRLQVRAVAGRPHQGGAGGRRPVRRDDEHDPAHRERAGQGHGGRRAAAHCGERRGGDGHARQAAAAGARREELRAHRADERRVRALCLRPLGGHRQEGRRLRQGEEAAGGGEHRDRKVRPRRQGHRQALAARGPLQHVRP